MDCSHPSLDWLKAHEVVVLRTMGTCDSHKNLRVSFCHLILMGAPLVNPLPAFLRPLQIKAWRCILYGYDRSGSTPCMLGTWTERLLFGVCCTPIKGVLSGAAFRVLTPVPFCIPGATPPKDGKHWMRAPPFMPSGLLFLRTGKW